MNTPLSTSDVNTANLGHLQKQILTQLYAADPADFENAENAVGWVAYPQLHELLLLNTDHSATSENAWRASVSRSVHSLIDRGLVAGAHQQWQLYTGPDRGSQMWGYGEEPGTRSGNRPRMQYLTLTHPGRDVALRLLDEDVNEVSDE